jgi:uncharacterized membrane protein YfcA
MSDYLHLLLPLALMCGAILYTSVGHAGASAYIAIMTLFGLAPEVIKPTALALNVLVSAFISWRYIRNGYFDKRLAVLLIAGAIPAAYLGGYVQLDAKFYKPLVGLILLFAGTRLLITPSTAQIVALNPPKARTAGAAGAAIGLLSGLTGTGGGIFLSPLAVFRRWTTIRQVSGTAALFIFANSLAGLLGNFSAVRSLPTELPVYAAAVMVGALIGTRLGLRKFDIRGLRVALALVLFVAGGKFLFG